MHSAYTESIATVHTITTNTAVRGVFRIPAPGFCGGYNKSVQSQCQVFHPLALRHHRAARAITRGFQPRIRLLEAPDLFS